jgi:membrane associated rhomboid family serine protease
LENVWGAKRFLFFYLACGIGAAICHEAVQYFRYEDAMAQAYTAFESGNIERAQELVNRFGPAVGASGAVMGVMVAFALLFPNTELYLMFIPIPIKAKWAIMAFVALDLFGGVSNYSGDNIAHFAHLGGALTGFIIVMIWNKRNRKTLY